MGPAADEGGTPLSHWMQPLMTLKLDRRPDNGAIDRLAKIETYRDQAFGFRSEFSNEARNVDTSDRIIIQGTNER